MRPGSLGPASSAAIARGDIRLGTAGPNKSRYRGVSYDKKKRKWRVQIKVRPETCEDTMLILSRFSTIQCANIVLATDKLLL